MYRDVLLGVWGVNDGVIVSYNVYHCTIFDNGSDDGVTIMAEHDIKLRAKNNTIITSDNITIDAKERIISHSEGWQILIGQYIRLHEPQTKICPAFLTEYIEGQIKTLKN